MKAKNLQSDCFVVFRGGDSDLVIIIQVQQITSLMSCGWLCLKPCYHFYLVMSGHCTSYPVKLTHRQSRASGDTQSNVTYLPATFTHRQTGYRPANVIHGQSTTSNILNDNDNDNDNCFI